MSLVHFVGAVAVLLACIGCGTIDATPTPAPPTPTPPATPIASPAAEAREFADIGLERPVAVLYDAAADVYLVANLNAAMGPSGFISRLRPDGTADPDDVRWIDGAGDPDILQRPTSLAIVEDQLYVADGTVVRVFDRVTGEPLTTIPVPEAERLRDVAVDSVGTILVTETHDIGGEPHEAMYEISPDGDVRTRYRLVPARPVQTIDLVIDDGTILVPTWTEQSQVRIRPDVELIALLQAIRSPAAIGLDTERQLLLLPDEENDRVLAVPVLDISGNDRRE